MQHFFGCSEESLLGLAKERFWNKFKNMRILQIRQEKYDISTMRIAHVPGDVSNHFYKLNWQEEQLTGVEKISSFKDSKLGIKVIRKSRKKKGIVDK